MNRSVKKKSTGIQRALKIVKRKSKTASVKGARKVPSGKEIAKQESAGISREKRRPSIVQSGKQKTAGGNIKPRSPGSVSKKQGGLVQRIFSKRWDGEPSGKGRNKSNK